MYNNYFVGTNPLLVITILFNFGKPKKKQIKLCFPLSKLYQHINDNLEKILF